MATDSKNAVKEIKADIYSRPNALNGLYAELNLTDLLHINNSDLFYADSLKIKADLVDKLISEVLSQGKDVKDSQVKEELLEKINSIETLVQKKEAVGTSFFVALKLIFYYGIAIGIWGLAFNGGFLKFALIGGVVGLIINLFFISPVISNKRTKEEIKETVFAVGALWGGLSLIVGIVGLIIFVVKLFL